ncbi:chymotrypsin-2-like isoform X2 [Agrilus planipennis]|uniref:Chymotrypsin-2-like isoform X2 n=1 Tax=Agrilus planipennis TaxID=224129 RepID=A0A1W4WW77_AGRPL|nr:chymotrypsin-2-like isoform X2 [Agrilus planipennis]
MKTLYHVLLPLFAVSDGFHNDGSTSLYYSPTRESIYLPQNRNKMGLFERNVRSSPRRHYPAPFFIKNSHLYKSKPRLRYRYRKDKDYSGEDIPPSARMMECLNTIDPEDLPPNGDFFSNSMDEPVNRIFSEENDTDIEGYPYQVVVVFKSGRAMCGGAIIADKFVLTAAHCFVSLESKDYRVKAGISNLDEEGQQRQGVKVFKHEKYSKLFDYDIGILMVDEPFEFNKKVAKIKLPDSECFKEGDMVTIIGYGQYGTPNVDLFALEVPSTTREKCMKRKYGPQNIEITDRMICVDTPKGLDICYGDSGSPVAKDGYIIGVVSHGTVCDHGDPVIFTNVTYFLNWIYNIISKNE